MKIQVMLALLLVSGCATKTATVRVLSDPPGARIEVNDDYLGVTPLELYVPVGWFGELLDSLTINALPVAEGQVNQSKFFMFEEIPPKTVFFDMYLKPVYNPNRIEVDLR